MIATYPKGGKPKTKGVRKDLNQRLTGSVYYTRAKLYDSDEGTLDRQLNFYGKNEPVDRDFGNENDFRVAFVPHSPV